MKRSVKILLTTFIFSSFSLFGMDSNNSDAKKPAKDPMSIIDTWLRCKQDGFTRSMQTVGLKEKKTPNRLPKKIINNSLPDLEANFQKKYSQPLLATVATDSRHVLLFKTLLEKEGVLLDDASLADLLSIAARHENVPGSVLLVKRGASPSYQDETTGYTPLMAAVEGDSYDRESYLNPTQKTVDIVSALVQSTESINNMDNVRKETALGKAEARKLSVSGFNEEDQKHQYYMDQIITQLRSKGASPLIGNRYQTEEIKREYERERADKADRLARVLSGGELQVKEDVKDAKTCGPFPKTIAKLIAVERFNLNEEERRLLFNESITLEEKKEERVPIPWDLVVPSPQERARMAKQTSVSSVGDET